MKELIEQCRPMPGDKDQVYFRPFSGGDPEDAKIFLAGINPATVITKSDVKFAEYRRMLLQPELKDFDELYKKIRETNGNTEESPTRVGIRSFSEWLRNESGKEVLETDIVAYPTPSVDDLRITETALVEKGIEIFIDLLKMKRPEILIVHGKDALSYLLCGIKDRIDMDPKLNKKDISSGIRTLEKKADPLFTINFSKGKKCKVFVCRHLQYYGHTGESYKDFKCYLKEKIL
jgi:hypothetical protein